VRCKKDNKAAQMSFTYVKVHFEVKPLDWANYLIESYFPDLVVVNFFPTRSFVFPDEVVAIIQQIFYTAIRHITVSSY